MNLQTIVIPGSQLGTTVELRELTMDGYMEAQAAVANIEDGIETSLQYLVRMLYVDGQPVTREQLGQYGMSQILPLINKLNSMFPQAEEGED